MECMGPLETDWFQGQPSREGTQVLYLQETEFPHQCY
jgi:hypothetical protein